MPRQTRSIFAAAAIAMVGAIAEPIAQRVLSVARYLNLNRSLAVLDKVLDEPIALDDAQREVIDFAGILRAFARARFEIVPGARHTEIVVALRSR